MSVKRCETCLHWAGPEHRCKVMNSITSPIKNCPRYTSCPATGTDEVEQIQHGVTSPATPGMKFDSDKLRYDLVPPSALEKIVDVLTYGAKKYAPENWKKVEEPERRYIAAAMRHIEAFRKGERLDPESGLPHLAHAACCLMFILEVQHGQE